MFLYLIHTHIHIIHLYRYFEKSVYPGKIESFPKPNTFSAGGNSLESGYHLKLDIICDSKKGTFPFV